MSAEENKDIVRRLLEKLYDKRNVDIFDEVYAADYKGHIPSSTLESPEAAKQFNLAMDKAFPDSEFFIEDLLADGDSVAIRWTFRGTHQGDLIGPTMTIPTTGKRLEFEAMSLFRFSDGKIVESWGFWDGLSLMRQLGLLPDPSQPEEASNG